ncbi:MAG TPA: hypothetical protein VJV96_03320 [Candidatus Angelobacter sp.]|jgi:hypothetical protein|nr:hypothetical protein [Candidatus Angelobacter sp.]
MAYFSAPNDDRMLQELKRHERRLNTWLDSSPANVILFIEDPVAALRAANLGISESILGELQETMNGIFQKLAFAS